MAVRLDEEGTALQAEGRLEEAKQKFVEASRLLNYVLKSDVRTKNPKIKAMIFKRMAEVIARAEECKKLTEAAAPATISERTSEVIARAEECQKSTDAVALA